MKKLTLLLVFVLVFLAACGTAEPAVDETTTETTIETTAETVTEAPFEYIYLTDEEIREVFGTAISVYFLFATGDLGLWVALDEEPIDGFHRVTHSDFQRMADVENAVNEQFSATIAQQLWAHPNTQFFGDIDGQLFAQACGGRGGSPVELDFIRIEEQSPTRVRYLKQTSLDERISQLHFTRELIDGRWVFTEFPGWEIQ